MFHPALPCQISDKPRIEIVRCVRTTRLLHGRQLYWERLTDIPHMLKFLWAFKVPINDKLTVPMNTKRTHVVLEEELVEEIDRLVGARQRSSFLSEAARKELMRRRQIEALKAAAGSWKDKDHPELKQGSARWTRKMRQESERRFKKVTIP